MTGRWVRGKFVVRSHGVYFALTKEQLAELKELIKEELKE